MKSLQLGYDACGRPLRLDPEDRRIHMHVIGASGSGKLSSVQYYSLEEQLTELTAALKEQYARHCFIKIGSEETEPMLVPKVEGYYTSPRNMRSYEDKLLARNNALPAATVDQLIAAQETALLQSAGRNEEEAIVIDIPTSEVLPAEPEPASNKPSQHQQRAPKKKSDKKERNIFDELLGNT